MSMAGDQSALVVAFHDLAPLVGQIRRRHDPAAGAGMPPHVTLIYPFLAPSSIDQAILAAIAGLAAAQAPFAAAFNKLSRFPGTLCLEPEPAGRFVAMTEALAGRFPQTPPYGGRHDAIVPHLTIAVGETEAAIDRLARDFLRGPGRALPVPTEYLLR